MTVTVESLTSEHLGTPALKSFLQKETHAPLLALDKSGGIALAVLKDGQVVGILTVSDEREVMVAIIPDHQRQGTATAAINLLRPIAVASGIKAVTARVLHDKAGSRLVGRFSPVEVERTPTEICYRLEFVDA